MKFINPLLLCWPLLCYSIASESANKTEPAKPEPNKWQWHYQIADQAMQTAVAKSHAPWLPIKQILEQSITHAQQSQKPIKTTVKLPSWNELEQSIGALPPLQILTQVSPQGQGISQLHMDAIQHSFTEKEIKGVLTFKGLQGEIEYVQQLQQPKIDLLLAGLEIKTDQAAQLSLDAVKLKLSLDAAQNWKSLQFQLPAMRLLDKKEALSLKNLTVQGENQTTPTGLILSNNQMNLERLAVKSTEGDGQIEGIAMQMRSQLADNLVNYVFDIAVKRLSLPPSVSDINQFSYQSQFLLHKIDGEALKAIQQNWRELEKQYQLGMPEELLSISFMGKLVEVLPKILAHSPEFHWKTLKIHSNQGDLVGEFKLKIDGNQPLDFENPVLLLSALTAHGQFFMDDTLLKSLVKTQMQHNLAAAPQKFSPAELDKLIDAEIGHYIAANQLVKAGKRYQTTLAFQDNVLTVNGQPVALPPSIALEQQSLTVKNPKKTP